VCTPLAYHHQLDSMPLLPQGDGPVRVPQVPDRLVSKPDPRPTWRDTVFPPKELHQSRKILKTYPQGQQREVDDVGAKA
jgi:hypothetical protein